MIVAYHKGTVVYAYKGVFNRNIDYEWSGAILMDHRKIIDQCTANNGVHPSPIYDHIVGITFSKYRAYNYYKNDGTVKGSPSNPIDNRWDGCELPSTISTSPRRVPLTLSIFVR